MLARDRARYRPLHHYNLTLLLVSALLLLPCAALRDPAQQQAKSIRIQQAADDKSDRKGLNTYYFNVQKPVLQNMGPGSRPGTTRLTMQFKQQQVSPSMPVVHTTLEGMSHTVVDTWNFFENYALQTQLLQHLPAPPGNSKKLYPLPAVALAASSALKPPCPSQRVHNVVEQAEAANKRHLWTHRAPPNILMLPSGQHFGAIADVVSVRLDQQGVLTADLEVVHAPQLVSELQEHPDQDLQDKPHYHFYTPPGVQLSATRLLDMLRPGTKLQGEGSSASSTPTVLMACRANCHLGAHDDDTPPPSTHAVPSKANAQLASDCYNDCGRQAHCISSSTGQVVRMSCTVSQVEVTTGCVQCIDAFCDYYLSDVLTCTQGLCPTGPPSGCPTGDVRCCATVPVIRGTTCFDGPCITYTCPGDRTGQCLGDASSIGVPNVVATGGLCRGPFSGVCGTFTCPGSAAAGPSCPQTSYTGGIGVGNKCGNGTSPCGKRVCVTGNVDCPTTESAEAEGVICRGDEFIGTCGVRTCSGRGLTCDGAVVPVAGGTPCEGDGVSGVCGTFTCSGLAANGVVCPRTSYTGGIGQGNKCGNGTSPCGKRVCAPGNVDCPSTEVPEAANVACRGNGFTFACGVKTCSGNSLDCTGAVVPLQRGTTCGDPPGPCAVRACDGTNITCPVVFIHEGYPCRDPSTNCEGTCDGKSINCNCPVVAGPDPDPGAVCRASTGPCDVAERYDENGNCPADKFHVAGTLCRHGRGPCEEDSVCDGEDGKCRKAVVANGKHCRFDPADEALNGIYWPEAKMSATEGWGSYRRERRDHAPEEYYPPHEEPNWPECWGKCQAGDCQLDKRMSGCCRVAPASYRPHYAEVQKMRTVVGPSGSTREEEKVYCWKGTY